MDNIAHTLSGLAVRDVSPKSLFNSKPFFWVALVVANIPDIDIFAWFRGQEFYFNVHRGITHSAFLIPFWGLLGAAAAYLISKKSLPFLKTWLWYSIIVVVHIFLDWITSYGTEIFAPLTNKTYSAHLFPIVDIWVILPMLALVIIGRFFSKYRQQAALVIIALLVLYTGFRITMKFGTERMIRRERAEAEWIMSFADTQSWRTWINPSLYRVVAVKGDSAFSYAVAPIGSKIAEQGRFDLFDSTDGHWSSAVEYELGYAFLRRSNLPIRMFRGDSLFVSDLRYTADFDNWGSLTLYYPLKDGEIAGAPEFLRPEVELR